MPGDNPLFDMLPIWVPSFASSQDIQVFPIGTSCGWPANRPHPVKERQFSFFLLKLQEEYARLSILWLLIKHLPCAQRASALVLGPCYPDLLRPVHAQYIPCQLAYRSLGPQGQRSVEQSRNTPTAEGNYPSW